MEDTGCEEVEFSCYLRVHVVSNGRMDLGAKALDGERVRYIRCPA